MNYKVVVAAAYTLLLHVLQVVVVQLALTCGPVPVKSNTADRLARSIVTFSAIGVPAGGRIQRCEQG